MATWNNVLENHLFGTLHLKKTPIEKGRRLAYLFAVLLTGGSVFPVYEQIVESQC